MSTLGQEPVCYNLEKGDEGSSREEEHRWVLCNIRCLFSDTSEWHVKKNGLRVISSQATTEGKGSTQWDQLQIPKFNEGVKEKSEKSEKSEKLRIDQRSKKRIRRYGDAKKAREKIQEGWGGWKLKLNVLHKASLLTQAVQNRKRLPWEVVQIVI